MFIDVNFVSEYIIHFPFLSKPKKKKSNFACSAVLIFDTSKSQRLIYVKLVTLLSMLYCFRFLQNLRYDENWKSHNFLDGMTL